ncbi:MAG: polysaccharide biosynthesis/export family protein [Pseudomonadota bacterium]
MIRCSPLAVAAVLLLGGCASSQLDAKDYASDLPPPSAGGVVAPIREYRIGPFDKISVQVFQNRDLGVDGMRVPVTGRVLLPMIGEVEAAGRTTTELSAEISERLGKCCLQNPQVVVQVDEAVSQQVTITGAVEEQGVFAMRGPTTLLQAISMAKGPNSTASSRVAVFRTVNGQRMGALFDLDAIRAGRAKDPEIFGGDTIVVDTSSAKSAWRGVIGSVPFLGVFGPLL